MPNALSRKNVWAAMPDGVRGAVGGLLGALPHTWLLGRRFRQTLAFAQDAQWWPAERAVAYQLEMMRRLCTAAVAGSQYYRRMFASVGADPRDLTSLEAVQRLPMIDRHTISNHLDAMRIEGSRWRQIDAVSTGGTGGSPLHFYIGAGRSAIEYAYLCAGWMRAGFRPGMPLAVFRGRLVPPDARGLRHSYDSILRHHYYSGFHLDDRNIERYLTHVESLGPCYLHVYPSSAGALSRYIRRSGRRPPANVRGILSESEILYPNQRVLIENTFGRACFSSYGQTEKVVAATGCEGSTLYHVWPTYGLFELIDDYGRPVTTPGQRGEIVGTSFINDVVPFIRYRTGDFATYVSHRCNTCGREQPILAEILGHRTQECLVAGDGTRVSWTAINVHDDTFARVQQFQFVQRVPGQAELQVVPGIGYTDADGERIGTRLRRILDGLVTVEITPVDAIRLSPVGKAIFVDQRIEGVTRESEHNDLTEESMIPRQAS